MENKLWDLMQSNASKLDSLTSYIKRAFVLLEKFKQLWSQRFCLTQPSHSLWETVACLPLPPLSPPLPAAKESKHNEHDELKKFEKPKEKPLPNISLSHSKSSNAKPLSPRPTTNRMKILKKENLFTESDANKVKIKMKTNGALTMSFGLHSPIVKNKARWSKAVVVLRILSLVRW